jgi:hypothetical protein
MMIIAMDTENLDDKLDAHIAGWRARALSVTPTNKHMAELGINALYRKVLGKPPAHIVWCESPSQFAVIPSVVTSILDTAPWNHLKEELRRAGKPGTPEWEACWKRGWARLRDGQVKWFERQANVSAGTRHSGNAAVRERTIERIGEALREIAVAGKLRPGDVSCAPGREHELNLAKPETNDQFVRSILLTAQDIEKRCGLKWRWGSMTFLAVGRGIFDERMIGALIPPLDRMVNNQYSGDEEVRKHFEKLRSKCESLEADFLRMYVWLLRLNPMWAVLPFVLWTPYALPWLAFATGAHFIDQDVFQGELDREIEYCAHLAHGGAGYLFTDRICYALAKPTELSINEARQIHNGERAAIRWSDGSAVYSWKGVIVSSRLIRQRARITAEEISKQANAEIRRVMIDLYGEARYLQDANAKCIHEDMYGKLYRLELQDDEPLVMVRVMNSTPEPDGTYKPYFLRVPPTIRRAKEAVAWSFGLAESEYFPRKET